MRIAIASGKGGTGKTFLATNLFFALQQHGFSPTLVDCDAEEPNAHLFFKYKQGKSADVIMHVPEIDAQKCNFCGACHEYCNFYAIFIMPPAKIIRVLEELCHGCGACVYACKNHSIKEKEISIGTIERHTLANNTSLIIAKMDVGMHSPVKVIQAGIKEGITDHLVILDAPPGTSCPFIQTVAHADFVVLVTEPTPFGVSDLNQSVKVLEKMNKRFGVVINRCDLGNRDVYNYLELKNIPLLMEIPFKKTYASEYAMGKLVAKTDTDFMSDLIKLFGLITIYSGNGHYQR